MNNPKLIFVVDDDPFINMLVVKRFASEKCRIDAFSCGEDCLDALNKNPDLVILDYLFVNNDQETMNGMEVFTRIRKLKPHIPVIILSCQEKGEIVLDLARKGIDDYIIKDDNLLNNLNLTISSLFVRQEAKA
jgi:CheY-like chemotaxis protein